MNRVKTYVLVLSSTFPKSHRKAGDPTEFFEKIEAGIKRHTIRANYDLWAKRFEEIEKGNAILSLRYWEGKPYASKQGVFKNLRKADGIGVERLTLLHLTEKKRAELALNDGLLSQDFEDWFAGYDWSKPMAIIHFSPFRYKTNE